MGYGWIIPQTKDDDISMATPPQINNANEKEAKRLNVQNNKDDVAITPLIINQNTLQATTYGKKYTRRWDFHIMVEPTTDNPEKALQNYFFFHQNVGDRSQVHDWAMERQRDRKRLLSGQSNPHYS